MLWVRLRSYWEGLQRRRSVRHREVQKALKTMALRQYNSQKDLQLKIMVIASLYEVCEMKYVNFSNRAFFIKDLESSFL
jgi:hypothetical protein